MNDMYKYLEQHSYISKNKKSNYQFELSEERAECIANKYNCLVKDLQAGNQKLKNNWNRLNEHIKSEWTCFDNESVEFEVSQDILNKMLELEKGMNR